jgi:hypothetical protein
VKFICLGYGDEQKWEAMPKDERDALIEECFTYDEKLLRDGHWLDGGQALQSAGTAKVLRASGGQVIVTDGPFAETKEQLGGYGVLEARDIDHAVELLSEHPCARLGMANEIRPVDEETLKRVQALDTKYRSQPAALAESTEQPARFACLGYISNANWSGTQNEFEAMIKECSEFDEARRRDGQWLEGTGLQAPATAKTLRTKGGKVVVTDGPYAETKEWLGGVVVLALKDMHQAVELLSTHPGLRYGVVIEIRPVDKEMTDLWEARQSRITSAAKV